MAIQLICDKYFDLQNKLHKLRHKYSKIGIQRTYYLHGKKSCAINHMKYKNGYRVINRVVVYVPYFLHVFLNLIPLLCRTG